MDAPSISILNISSAADRAAILASFRSVEAQAGVRLFMPAPHPLAFAGPDLDNGDRYNPLHGWLTAAAALHKDGPASLADATNSYASALNYGLWLAGKPSSQSNDLRFTYRAAWLPSIAMLGKALFAIVQSDYDALLAAFWREFAFLLAHDAVADSNAPLQTKVRWLTGLVDFTRVARDLEAFTIPKPAGGPDWNTALVTLGTSLTTFLRTDHRDSQSGRGWACDVGGWNAKIRWQENAGSGRWLWPYVDGASDEQIGASGSEWWQYLQPYADLLLAVQMSGLPIKAIDVIGRGRDILDHALLIGYNRATGRSFSEAVDYTPGRVPFRINELDPVTFAGWTEPCDLPGLTYALSAIHPDRADFGTRRKLVRAATRRAPTGLYAGEFPVPMILAWKAVGLIS